MVPPEKDNLVKSPVKPSPYAQMKVDPGHIGGRKFKHLPMDINFKTYICKYYTVMLVPSQIIIIFLF